MVEQSAAEQRTAERHDASARHGSAPAGRAPRRRSFVRRRPWTSSGIALLLLLVVAAYAVAFLIDEQLRRSMEGGINRALDGYTVSIGSLDLHPIGLSVDLEDVVVTQDAHPDPPIATLPSLEASVHWRALLSGDLVADFVFDSPTLFLSPTHAREEANDERDVGERGWQQAAREIYPLEINALRVNDGTITYDDGSELAPIEVSDLHFVAENIRNVSSREGSYPSPVELDAAVFGEGRASFDGAADFLAEPHATVRGDVAIEGMPLTKLTPLARTYAIHLSDGTLSLDGEIEAASQKLRVALDEVVVDGVRADFVRAGGAGARGERAAQRVAREATDPEPAQKTEVVVERLAVTDAELGFVDREADPSYRVFVSAVDLEVEDFSNVTGAGRGRARVEGSFMGSGPLDVQATFQPSEPRTEFSSSLEIRDVDMLTMNDLFRAQGGFDVKAGTFSVFSEVAVHEGRVDGYVKPLFGELGVYDRRQDADDNLFQQAYEGIVGGIGELLENTPNEEVATRADLSGPIENPDASTWEIVIGLIQNAFFKAILPGLDRRAGGS